MTYQLLLGVEKTYVPPTSLDYQSSFSVLILIIQIFSCHPLLQNIVMISGSTCHLQVGGGLHSVTSTRTMRGIVFAVGVDGCQDQLRHVRWSSMLHSLTGEAQKDDSEADGWEWWYGGFYALIILSLKK